jgi:transcriptional regulator with XRE-family HTH domain
VNRSTVTSAVETSSGHVGGLLRHWRAARRVSQLDLALEADVSSRHLSFVETGRSQPSRDMVLRLAEALQVPLRERNALLLAAGYAPLYRETGLDAPEMAEARRAVEFILAQQEPYPAIVVDHHWNLLMANAATGRFLALFPECAVPGPPNALRLLFHPTGLRPFVENWEDVAGRLIQRVHREAAGSPPDAATKTLLEELLGYPGVPSRWRTPELDRPPAPLLTIVYRVNGGLLRFFSTVTTFGTPQDVTLQELRIECFFPGDETTRASFAGS